MVACFIEVEGFYFFSLKIDLDGSKFDFVGFAVRVVECSFPHSGVSEFVKDFVSEFVFGIVEVVLK